jgi:hypothetical protein
MRQLTLILSDLYLPAEAGRDAVAQAQPLPGLDWLLRFAAPVQYIDDWRRWLTLRVAGPELAELPPAQLAARAADSALNGVWLATPVHLEARLDHVRLADRGLLHLDRDQAHALSQEFAHTFGPQLSLAGGERGFVLRGGPDADAITTDPARLLDSDIGQALPSGSPAGGELRRLGTEIEMWLHGSRVNEARERARQKLITALWLWGGGLARPQPAKPAGTRDPLRLFGADFLLHDLARLLSGAAVSAAPASFAGIDAGFSSCVQLAPMSGPAGESLRDIETNWFAPARNALVRGSLDRLTLVANDRVFEVSARAGWKFWRPRGHWLRRLSHVARMTGA